jgi:hypothetical protein
MALIGIEGEVFNACGCHVGAGASKRNLSIRRRIAANSVRGVATSANSNTTRRA